MIHGLCVHQLMVSTESRDVNPSFEELRATGIFATEANCSQYLIDMMIHSTKKRCDCELCPDKDRMELKTCSTTRYLDGCCWQCPSGHVKSLKAHAACWRTVLRLIYDCRRAVTGLSPCYHGTVAVLSWSCRGTVAVLSWHCRRAVMALSLYCRRAVVEL